MRRLQPAASAARNSASKPLSNSAINTFGHTQCVTIPVAHDLFCPRPENRVINGWTAAAEHGFQCGSVLLNLRLFFRFQSLNPFLIWVYDRRRMFESLVPFVVIIVLVLVILWLIDQA